MTITHSRQSIETNLIPGDERRNLGSRITHHENHESTIPFEGIAMANFCYSCDSNSPLTSVQMGLPEVIQVGLWGGGGAGEDLNIVVTGPPIVTLSFPEELKGFPVPNLRVFEITSASAGQTVIEAKVPRTGASYAGKLQVNVGAGTNDLAGVGLSRFYHGTSLDKAKELIGMDIVPFSVIEGLLLDINEYTDFGKGFYTHPEESKRKAVEWAKRRNPNWGVVRFTLTSDEMGKIRAPAALHYPDKFKTRPANSPKLFDGKPATWLEFVEFNRHIRKISIARPKDNDWTTDFAWMRGPIWGRQDSNLPGAPGLPEHYHQINWGHTGMTVLNEPGPKRRRFLITKHNERLL